MPLPRSIFAALLAQVGVWCAAASYVSSTYDWDSRASNEHLPCLHVPANLSLCQHIGYTRMRVPDLLEHDTLAEILEQSASWVPLLNVRCHPDTQRFLCSLFTPVCVDPPIYPCRSLCEKVKSGCESRMRMYGFPWPEMFACHHFPMDNDMCITSEMAANPSEEKCKICEQVNTVENILDHYCQSNFAVRGKLRKVQHHQITFKKVKLFKANTADTMNAFKNEFFHFDLTEDCCRERMRENRSSYFIMGTHDGIRLNPSFIMLWEAKRSKSFKKSIRMLKTVNCTNPSTIIDQRRVTSKPIISLYDGSMLKHNKNQTETRRGRRRNRKRKTKTRKNLDFEENVNN